ncbi:hypothetical protein GCM10010228_31960 [Streptomyces massasporeus]|nr:hypothetical protein GCM10010228_31960 [Streptomyces massasporeus]
MGIRHMAVLAVTHSGKAPLSLRAAPGGEGSLFSLRRGRLPFSLRAGRLAPHSAQGRDVPPEPWGPPGPGLFAPSRGPRAPVGHAGRERSPSSRMSSSRADAAAC